MSAPGPPDGLLAELTHRCPLRCAYCSNPLDLARRSEELETADWLRVLVQAAQLGVLQVHFSGGEPTLRPDLEQLIAEAHRLELYSNLITSGAALDDARLGALEAAGLDHVQLSFQDTRGTDGDAMAGHRGAHESKLEIGRAIRARGLPLTVNAVIHRGNIDRIPDFIELALDLGARRIEIANVQYHGWAERNRSALLPRRAQLERARGVVEAARQALLGRLQIDFVPPDYYGRRPKACMDGWGRRFITVTPRGLALPCHAAHSIPGLRFDDVRERPLAEIWSESEAFERFRGEAWMREPCASCEARSRDFGGCRCQALALTGAAENADPVCEYSPHRGRVDDLIAEAEADHGRPPKLRGAHRHRAS